MAQPTHSEVLAAAVSQLGGAERTGQVAMADAVAEAFESGVHLMVQAGTGTGKSLGYLAPIMVRSAAGERVVIATATLALQAQLANTDIPVALDAADAVLGTRPSHAILKGRSNYACLLRVRDGVPDDQQTLLSGEELARTARRSGADEASVLGSEVLMLREWAEEQLAASELSDRDDAPTHTPRAWSQVSVPVRECLGAQRCPYGQECFVELSRDRARRADIVVTNHALLAIDAMHGHTALPEHELLVIDEAHELVSRVTGAASAELSPQMVERIARRAKGWLSDETALEFLESADVLRTALDHAALAQVTSQDEMLLHAFQQLRDVTRSVISALSGGGAGKDNGRLQAGSAVKELFDVAERMAALSPGDVVYISERERFGRQAVVSPLGVAGLMRDKVFADNTVVLTSATLSVGGQFEAVARSVGLRAEERLPDGETPSDQKDPQPWCAVDVGSPFDYARQGILYVAEHLPPPSREGISQAALDEVAQLVWAAGGRTLGLFASQRAAEAAAAHLRAELPSLTVLCQGEAQLPDLMRRFVADESISLFGTISLWQGVDVPGDTCTQVIIDKIPFPRPDDPLMQARQRAVAEAGGNGFMAVAATHAGLMLAQGSGRLIRRHTDRGVVAVLDPRLSTARYGSFLRASMPSFWLTNNHDTVVQSLLRLRGAA